MVHIVDDTGRAIAATTTKAYYQCHDTRDVANARLIAAAPDLHSRVAQAEKQADAALAKANSTEQEGHP